jgi:hypothetical protein
MVGAPQLPTAAETAGDFDQEFRTDRCAAISAHHYGRVPMSLAPVAYEAVGAGPNTIHTPEPDARFAWYMPWCVDNGIPEVRHIMPRRSIQRLGGSPAPRRAARPASSIWAAITAAQSPSQDQ